MGKSLTTISMPGFDLAQQSREQKKKLPEKGIRKETRGL
jgi:hypothetical protein